MMQVEGGNELGRVKVACSLRYPKDRRLNTIITNIIAIFFGE